MDVDRGGSRSGGRGFFCPCPLYPEKEEGGGAETVPGITPSASRIDELMTLLVDNRVGPVGLRDVIADWL